MRNLLTILLLSVSLLWGCWTPKAIADNLNIEKGGEIFSVHCVGCHAGGGNIIRRGKNLKQRALQRNGYDSIEAIAEIVANGKSNMSAYSDRLSVSEIQQVAAYVLDQAEKNWR
ncbi:cytochrome c6 [Limnospira platensis C1]|nr:cytochrome c6 [Arthrospira platensis C1]CDM95620.1 cytochrome c553 [Limnospira indica PCC 8005]